MELDNIEKLLEKYFEATTTVAEEKILQAYFSQESVATHLEQYKPMFNYFSNAKEERYTKQVPLKPRKNYYKWISVAAVAVLTFGIYFGNQYQEQRQAEYAYQETKKAFELLAENFGKGTEKVAYLQEFEVAKQKIYNNK
ncbi:hypothetical protein [Flagellimonas onchidii]|uniref:hypothetical protein n=1 Tax=Flagellimonas onchidii TaxID=2562684 RepID=UPI0010A5D3D6|nr:hypothetical protein [Allomuricauda onchidii]